MQCAAPLMPIVTRLAAAVATSLLVLGCGSRLPEQITDCKDTACRLAWLNEALARDPAAATAGLDTIPDQIERIALVSELTEANPGKTAALCPRLPRGASRDRCDRINGRPHLWNKPMETNSELPRTRDGGGPPTSLLPAPPPSSSRYSALRGGPGPCANRSDVNACLQAGALRDARAGNAEGAALSCAGIVDEKWRAECMFVAAETIVLDRGVAGYKDSVDLCTAAGDFATNCLSHTLIELADWAPDATSSLAEDWAPVLEAADIIRVTWAERDPALGALYEARYWSEVARLAYARTPVVTGSAVDHLPAASLPFVRAAAAASLLRTQTTSSSASLETLVNQLETALTTRAAQRVEKKRGNFFEAPLDLWPEDVAGDEVVPAIVHLGTSRRTWSDDPRADLAICLLEAAAREAITAHGNADVAKVSAWNAVITQGKSWPDPRVQWTANRLLTRFPPEFSMGPAGN